MSNDDLPALERPLLPVRWLPSPNLLITAWLETAGELSLPSGLQLPRPLRFVMLSHATFASCNHNRNNTAISIQEQGKTSNSNRCINVNIPKTCIHHLLAVLMWRKRKEHIEDKPNPSITEAPIGVSAKNVHTTCYSIKPIWSTSKYSRGLKSKQGNCSELQWE